MRYMITILRKERGSEERYTESFIYESADEAATVASALTWLDAQSELRNAEGEKSRRIEWECSCLQKKCGACAMVINGRPALACDARLADLGSGISLAPLGKFPCICDLTVDRSIMMENLRNMKLWMKADSELADKYRDLAYESSECIQCGCCLEVCPNFYSGGRFTGMAAVPVTGRLLSALERKQYIDIAREYSKHVFAGCGKSLACMDVCPRGIDTEKLLVNANALAVWKRRK